MPQEVQAGPITTTHLDGNLFHPHAQELLGTHCQMYTMNQKYMRGACVKIYFPKETTVINFGLK